MTGTRKPCGALEEDLVNVPTRKKGSAARCVPFGTDAMVLPICTGDQHKAEAYEHSIEEEGTLKLVSPKEENREETEEEGARRDESSKER